MRFLACCLVLILAALVLRRGNLRSNYPKPNSNSIRPIQLGSARRSNSTDI